MTADCPHCNRAIAVMKLDQQRGSVPCCFCGTIIELPKKSGAAAAEEKIAAEIALLDVSTNIWSRSFPAGGGEVGCAYGSRKMIALAVGLLGLCSFLILCEISRGHEIDLIVLGAVCFTSFLAAVWILMNFFGAIRITVTPMRMQVCWGWWIFREMQTVSLDDLQRFHMVKEYQPRKKKCLCYLVLTRKGMLSATAKFGQYLAEKEMAGLVQVTQWLLQEVGKQGQPEKA